MIKKMIKKIDGFLDHITMYRFIMYYLTAILAAAFVLSLFGLMPFSAISLVMSLAVILLVSWVANALLAIIFKVHTNSESVYITAFILALIVSPPQIGAFGNYVTLAVWSAIFAMVSKYAIAINRKHIFNPAALGVALVAMTLGQSSSWWVGTAYLLPIVLVGGLLMTRKIRRSDLVISFFIAAIISILGNALIRGVPPMNILVRVALETPIFFFAFVMLTEPLTTPPNRPLRIVYGVIVGVLFAPWVHIGSIYSTPELALLAGNIFSYAVSPKQKLLLRLKKIVKQTPDVSEFIFETDPGEPRMHFAPGQYLEWTLAHQGPDSRGNRRYFTIASSPAELERASEIRMGVKFYGNSSTFKKKLIDMKPGDDLIAGQLAGDFVMPKDKGRKLVFLAGGIGVTPFRSMIKDLLDRQEKRQITMLYSAKTGKDMAYRDIFDEAYLKLGIETVYFTSEGRNNVNDVSGRIDSEAIKKFVPDYTDRLFYISGPQNMVDSFRELLLSIGIKSRNIKTDFFPGFA